MKLVLLVRTYPKEVRNGFDAYANSLIGQYRKEGIDFEVWTGKDTPLVNDPKLSPLLYDLLFPLSHISKRSKGGTVFHAISESQALIFPFIKGRKVVTIHHVEKPQLSVRRFLRANTAYDLFWRFCTDLAVKYSDRIICISDQTRSELVESYGIEEGKITVISQAVSDKYHEDRTVRDSRLIGYIGPFTARKNIPALFQVLRYIHERPGFEDVRMKICGSGPGTPVQDAMAANRDLAESIIFKGELPEGDIVREYNEMAAFLFPSLHEGFGLSIVEAQRCGLPVFILEEAKIPPEVSLYAIKCASVQDMAEKVMDYLEGRTPYDKAKAIEHAGKFSEQARAKRTIAFYDMLDG